VSILSGLPAIPDLPPGLLGDGVPTATPGDPATMPTTDPAATPGDVNGVGPVKQSSLTNLGSSGTSEATSATQDAPITRP
jgi:hypothetical protein